MPYIVREDGEHFVIPSYRDVLAARKKSQLKKDILQLSQSYGEYITLQRKGAAQYEIAFSPDPGYLLGESVWHYFKRPLDMIYCEAIPNTTEAMLVIVKEGSVYLDGRFPIEGIPEELIVFLTQQNHFEIYTYGDVPISETPAPGKFTFESKSVKSFAVLDKPVFATLPLLKTYQFHLVDTVLKAHGIGVFPLRQILSAIVAMCIIWIIYSYMTTSKEELFIPRRGQAINPYQAYITALTTPAPDQELKDLRNALALLFTLPGWSVKAIDYANGTLTAQVQSIGSKISLLQAWADQNNAVLAINPTGISLSMTLNTTKRPIPTQIYPINQVISQVVDDLSTIYPGNHIILGDITNKGNYKTINLTINMQSSSPLLLTLIDNVVKDLPLVLQQVTLTIDSNGINGSMIFQALGN